LPIDKPSDRRQFGRRRVFKAGIIVQGDNQRLPITIMDISDGGARIKTAEPHRVEKEFSLEIPEDDFVVKCRLVWLEEDAVGAEFIKSPRRLSWVK
jgi:hypothetical protein